MTIQREGMFLRLGEPLREAVKKAAKASCMTETVYIREAVKFRLRRQADDPLFWLEPMSNEIKELTVMEQAHQMTHLEMLYLLRELSTEKTKEEASKWSTSLFSKLKAKTAEDNKK